MEEYILFGRELLLQGVQWGLNKPPYMLRPLKAATMNFLIGEQTISWSPETINAFFDQQMGGQIM
jgi:hypothetical protein